VNQTYVHRLSIMGTVVTIQIVGNAAKPSWRHDCGAGIDRAVGWFRHVEAACNRFDPSSEIAQLSRRIGDAVPVSDALVQCVTFALALAQESDGAFDPTVGRLMEQRGFDRDYRSGDIVRSPIEGDAGATFRDVYVDAENRTITLTRPLVLDLGAVAKGLAVDMAARELAPFVDFAIDAGGDLYLAGHNADGAPWSVGIRHPRKQGELIDTLQISNSAVCTSGDYERREPHVSSDHHILDPLTGEPARSVASVTVIAPHAMVADGLATAAFVLGPERGIALLDRHGVAGFIITPSLERFNTASPTVVGGNGDERANRNGY
jgi:thiamine biosynthesis lipoprotein